MRYPMPDARRLPRILPLLALFGLAACGMNPFAKDVPDPSAAVAPAQAEAAQAQRATSPRYEPEPMSQPVYESMAPSSPPVRLRANHPDRYVVVRGDTLWDISARFLEDPWLWPEIWQVNPQIQNPHLIYPGDVISLVYIDGRPQLRIERGAPAGLRTERLSPQVRVEQLDQAIDTIPYALIEPFISRPTVLEKGEAERLPYVLSTKGHLLAGADFEVYVRSKDGKGFNDGSRYSVVHVGDKLRDPDNGDTLGYEAAFVGEGRIIRDWRSRHAIPERDRARGTGRRSANAGRRAAAPGLHPASTRAADRRGHHGCRRWRFIDRPVPDCGPEPR